MAGNYYIYECKPCDHRWGTYAAGYLVSTKCNKCMQPSYPIESRATVRSEYHCKCGYRWRCLGRGLAKCFRCRAQVPPVDAGLKDYEETESSWKYLGEQKKPHTMRYGEHTEAASRSSLKHDQDVSGERSYPDTEARVPSTRHGRTMEEEHQESENYFHEGNRYFMKAKYELAVENFTKAIELSPSNADYYQNRSLAYMKLDQVHEAQNDLRRSIKCSSDDTTQPELNHTAADVGVNNVQQGVEELRFGAKTRHSTEDSGYHDKQTSWSPGPAHNAGDTDTTGLNVIIMRGLFENNFKPVQLSKLLGVKLDNTTLQSIVHRELPSAVQQNNVMTFNPNTGSCYISEIPTICNNEAICDSTCDAWHICKRFILGCCPYGPSSCKMNHDFFHQKNAPLLNKNGLYGIDKGIMRALMLSQHRPDSLRPHVCKRYCSLRCKSQKCLFLHICADFMSDNCTLSCWRSHDLYDRRNKPAMDYYNVRMDGTIGYEEAAHRIRLWNPIIKPPNNFMTSSSTERRSSVTSSRAERPPFRTSSREERPPHVTSPRTEATRHISKTGNWRFGGYDVRTEMRDSAVEGRYRNGDDENSWGTARGPATARTAAATEPAAAKTAAVWQYNLGNTHWRNFLPEEQVELETALCDVKQEKKRITIEGRAVVVELNVVASEGVNHVTGGVVVRRTGHQDMWTWSYGSSLSKTWTKIEGQEVHDVQLIIERPYQAYRASNADHKLTVEVKSIGKVELDFEKWIVSDLMGNFLDIVRRPIWREPP